jgi:hypothetical protein
VLPWDDILTVSTKEERRLWGFPLAEETAAKAVEVRLKHWLRIGWRSVGTRGFGLPVAAKSVLFKIDYSEELSSLALSFLEHARDADAMKWPRDDKQSFL